MLNRVDRLLTYLDDIKIDESGHDLFVQPSTIKLTKNQSNQNDNKQEISIPNSQSSVSEQTTTDSIINDVTQAIKEINDEILNKYSKKIIQYFQQNINNYTKLSSITSNRFQKDISNFCKDKQLIASLQKLYKLIFKNKEGIIFDKNSNFGEWYREIVTKCDLIDYTDISGCYVLKPLSYFIWKQIRNYMDKHIESLGVEEIYFPLFASENALRLESTFFDGFTAEVAWVTHSGDNKLDKKIAVRPTSETIIYPMFKKWIQSHKDLPIKMNQWCNVVRWEFDNPKPFLRSREFLWQEGHTAYGHKKQAEKEVDDILELYANTYKNICAVPTIKGLKTKLETFPGAEYTKTVECFIAGSGRAIQAATSHHLGQKFSNDKAFRIRYLDKDEIWKNVYQNSWGFTTRSIGVMILSHSDNKGLVLPPKVAKIQIVIVTINNSKKLINKSIEISDRLKGIGLRVKVDDRKDRNFGYKCNEWELKGIPIRIEIGYNDINNNQCVVARRDMIDKREKVKINIDDNFENAIKILLDKMHNDLYLRAKEKLNNSRKTVFEWNDFLQQIQFGNIVDAPHCNSMECEKLILYESKEYFTNKPDIHGIGQTGKAKALCIPEEQKQMSSNIMCVGCKKKATKWILFGRSY